MIRKIIELIPDDLETVEDMIVALLKAPKAYTLHPLGEKCQLAIDHLNGCVYLDNPDTVGIISEEINDGNDTVDIDVPDEKLETMDTTRFVVVGYSKSNIQDVCGIFTTEPLASECGDELVEAKEIEYYEVEGFKLDEFGHK
jgi:hypothetical protein